MNQEALSNYVATTPGWSHRSKKKKKRKRTERHRTRLCRISSPHRRPSLLDFPRIFQCWVRRGVVLSIRRCPFVQNARRTSPGHRADPKQIAFIFLWPREARPLGCIWRPCGRSFCRGLHGQITVTLVTTDMGSAHETLSLILSHEKSG